MQKYLLCEHNDSDSEQEPVSREIIQMISRINIQNEPHRSSKRRSAEILPTETQGGKERRIMTSLMVAAISGEVESIDFLLGKRDKLETGEELEIREELEARDEQGRTALFLAAGSGEENSVIRLLECKANPDARDNTGATVLIRTIIACALTGELKYLNIVDHLVKLAEPSARDSQGRTALMCAVVANCIPATRLLAFAYKGQQTLNIKDLQGETPFLYATKKRYETIREILLTAGADVTIQKNDRYSTLHPEIEQMSKLSLSAAEDIPPALPKISLLSLQRFQKTVALRNKENEQLASFQESRSEEKHEYLPFRQHDTKSHTLYGKEASKKAPSKHNAHVWAKKSPQSSLLQEIFNINDRNGLPTYNIHAKKREKRQTNFS